MPARAAQVNQTLTNYAQGISQDRTSRLANFIAPIVVTGIAHGQYKRYDEKNDFQVYDTSRALGGPRKRIEFGADDPFFNCMPQGLETTIDDHERELAGEGGILNLQQAKIRNLVGASHLSHENKVFTALKAAVSAVGGKGVWSSASNDPVEEIDEQIEAIATATGMMPNRIVFGVGAWRVFRNHAKVRERQPGAELIGLTKDQAARMMLNPSIQIEVGILSKDTAKFGKAKSTANIVGLEVFLFYGSDTPDQYDPSFAKTFTTNDGMIDAVKEYRDDNAVSDAFATDWSEEVQVTASATGRRLTIS